MNKIFQFAQGNIRLLGDEFNLLPKHLKEQVKYRYDLCKTDCVRYGKCRYCSCSLPGKFYVTESCNNGEIFPDLMSEEDWVKYKEQNKIK
jgi:hypothetical protein